MTPTTSKYVLTRKRTILREVNIIEGRGKSTNRLLANEQLHNPHSIDRRITQVHKTDVFQMNRAVKPTLTVSFITSVLPKSITIFEVQEVPRISFLIPREINFVSVHY